MKDKLKDKQVKCRICNGEHFTARCPFKDTMAPVGEEGTADVGAGPADTADGAGGLGSVKGSYVPPHIRNNASAAGGDRMGGGKYERDDLATLRVTNVSLRLLYCSHDLADILCRSRKWQKSRNFGICSNDSVGLRGSFWRRIGRLVWLRGLPSSASRRGQMLRKRARRWMVMDSSISFYEWSLQRKLLRCCLRLNVKTYIYEHNVCIVK